jgi:hypothetical protein
MSLKSSCSRSVFAGLAFSLVLSISLPVQALLLSYEQVAFDGVSRYEYSYMFLNDDLAAGIDAFSIFYGADHYANLAITASPTGWDPLVFQPDPILGDGFADWLALVSPIALGDSLGGFNVAFDWIAPGSTPFASQPFKVYDPNTFALLASGETSRVQDPTVPVPGSLGLLCLGLVALSGGRFKKRQK